jgi:hypothetical protein
MANLVVNKTYTGYVTVQNATAVNVTGLPAGLVVTSTVPVGTGLVINFGGAPTQAGASYTINVSATNACGGGSTTSTATKAVATGTVASS